jgi:hypothetical protein
VAIIVDKIPDRRASEVKCRQPRPSPVYDGVPLFKR